WQSPANQVRRKFTTPARGPPGPVPHRRQRIRAGCAASRADVQPRASVCRPGWARTSSWWSVVAIDAPGINEYAVPAEARSVSISIDRVALPMEEPIGGAAGAGGRREQLEQSGLEKVMLDGVRPVEAA